LAWENRFSEGVVADLELLELEDATATLGVRDTIAVVDGEVSGIVRRLDGNSGSTKWEYKEDRLVFCVTAVVQANELLL
jgi:hypothetical protein